MINVLASAFKKIEGPMDGEAREAMEELRVANSGIVDVELQASAMSSAAAEIRAMANEAKLVEARTAGGTSLKEFVR
jgi:hypothetical protein